MSQCLSRHARKWTVPDAGRPADDSKCEIYSNDAMSKVSTGQFSLSMGEAMKLLSLGIS